MAHTDSLNLELMTAMSSKLVEKKVIILISDPWDFVTENGSRRTGVVLEVISQGQNGPYLKIKLDAPLAERDIQVDYLYAQARHLGKSFKLLDCDEYIPTNFSSCIPGGNYKNAICCIGALQLSADSN